MEKERRNIKTYRKFAVQAVVVILMYCGAYGIIKEMFQDMYDGFIWIDVIAYAVYYISAIMGGTIWLVYLWNNKRKTALAAHLVLTVCMACQLCEIIYECLFSIDAVGFEGVLIFGVTPGAALLTEVTIFVGYYRENNKFKSACIWYNFAIICIGISLYIMLYFCETATHLSENPDILFLIGIKGTLLNIMWEEGRRCTR